MSMRCSHRPGSALLVVLSFLSILAASAVAFATWMRASRTPVAVQQRTERGRFLLEAALARAMSDIDEAVGEQLSPRWPSRILGADQEGTTNGVVPVLTLEALAYLPGRLVESVKAGSRVATSARWKRFDFDAGRYAYLAVDVSDLPNVNGAAAWTNRSYDVSGRLSLAPFFPDETAARAYDVKTAEALNGEGPRHFVSLLDHNLSLGYARSVLTGEKESDSIPMAVVDSYLSNLACDRSGVALTDGAEAAWQVLEEQMTDEELAVLEDYLDTDRQPSSLELPCAERVPQIAAVGWTGKGLPQVQVTLAYPFRVRSDDGSPYVLKTELKVSAADGSFSKTLASRPEEVDVTEDFDEETHTCVLDLKFPESYLPPKPEGEEKKTVELSLRLACRVEEESGTVVDTTPELGFSMTTDGETAGPVAPVSHGVADARLNWKIDQWKPMEKSASEWEGSEAARLCFVSDAGYLQSVGELAFLPRESGVPFEPEDFDLKDDRGEGPRVDPTTSETNVLAMALVNTPVDWSSAATNAVSPRTLEQAFGATRADLLKLAERLLERFSSVADGEWLSAYDDFDWLGEGAGEDPFAGISFAERLTAIDRRYLRDYWRGCFAKKQQLFLVFLRVEYGPRGVAVVGRDPYPKTDDGLHVMRMLFYHQFEN